MVAVGAGVSPVFIKSSRVNRPARLPSAPLNIGFVGQSNAVAKQPGTLGYDFSGVAQYIDAKTLGFDESTGRFEQLRDDGAGINTAGGRCGGGQIGTLLMRRIADASGQAVRMLSLAYTSQGIAYFLPTSSTKSYYLDGSQHATLNHYQLFKKHAVTSGIASQLDLLVLIQGEADGGMSQSTYFGHLKTLIDAWDADYPRAHVIIVKTLEVDSGETSHAGVRAAQEQVAALYPWVHILDNSDMVDATAYWGGRVIAHYTDFAGYEEVAERLYALLRGTTRPNVSAVLDLEDIGVTWNHRWRYRHSIIQTTTDEVAVWQDDISVKSLQSGTVNPDHIASDPNFGGRPSVDFDVGSATYSVAGMPAGNTYTFWGVWRLANVSVTQLLCELSGFARIGLIAYTAANPGDMSAWYAGGDVAFNDPGVPVMNTNAHTFGVVIDAANTEARLYLDGVLVGTETISGTETTVNPTFYFSGFVSVANFFKGQVAEFALSTEAMNDAQAALAHAYAVVEYKDAF